MWQTFGRSVCQISGQVQILSLGQQWMYSWLVVDSHIGKKFGVEFLDQSETDLYFGLKQDSPIWGELQFIKEWIICGFL